MKLNLCYDVVVKSVIYLRFTSDCLEEKFEFSEILKMKLKNHHQSAANKRGLQAITMSYQRFLSAVASLISSIVGRLSLLINLVM